MNGSQPTRAHQPAQEPAADGTEQQQQAELKQTGLDERRPGRQWQRLGDVARRLVKKARRDG